MKKHAKIGGFGFENWGVGGFRGVIFTPQMGGLGVPHPNPGHVVVILRSFWGQFGVILWSFCGHFGFILGSIWGHFVVILGSFWGHFLVILRSFWGDLGVILGSFQGHFKVILDLVLGTTLKTENFWSQLSED